MPNVLLITHERVSVEAERQFAGVEERSVRKNAILIDLQNAVELLKGQALTLAG